jgi:large subunit ribosomal protein L30e
MEKATDKEVKDAEKAGKLLIGTKSVRKALKKGELKAVLCAENCPESMIKDLNHYATVSNTQVKEIKGNSDRLGEVCGKPFNILVTGIRK